MGLRNSTWLMIGTLSVLAIAIFRFNLVRLYQKTAPWSEDPNAANWGHSFFVPVIGLYYLYLNREELIRIPKQPLLGLNFSRFRWISGALLLVAGVALAGAGYFGWLQGTPLFRFTPYAIVAGSAMGIFGALILLLDWGLATLLTGLLVFIYGIHPGKNDWTSDMGIPMTIFGVVLTLCGWRTMRLAWFPIIFLIIAIPLPPLKYSEIASPLQGLAATIAVNVLNICGIESIQAGTKIIISRGINLPARVLNVAEACAGMRSLMTFISVGAAMAFLSSRPMWQKLIISISAIPIAIFCNVMRVSGQGLLDRLWSEEVSEGFAHAFVGLVMLIPAFFLLLGVQWMLDKLFVEEADEKTTQTPGVIRVNQNSIAPKASAGTVINARHDMPRRSGPNLPGATPGGATPGGATPSGATPSGATPTSAGESA